METLEEKIAQLNEKYIPLIREKELTKIAADAELRTISNEYSEKKIAIEEYYRAIEQIQEMKKIISNEIEI